MAFWLSLGLRNILSLPGNEVGEARGGFPGFVILRENDGNDRRELGCAGMVADVIVPNSDHVGEDTQAHKRIFLVLVLEKDVDVGGLAVDLRSEKQVAGCGSEFGVDEAAADKPQRFPIDLPGETHGQVGLEKFAGVIGVRKSGLREFVVRLVEGILGHGHTVYFPTRGRKGKEVPLSV